MSRLPALTPRRLVAALKRAGFIEHHQKGSHLFLWHAEWQRMTSVPMHSRDLPRGTLNAIIQQTGFTHDEFKELL